jgi:beta-glucanase (GH16 family)
VLLLVLVGGATALAAAGREPASPDRPPKGSPPHWHRVFADEFTKGLDRGSWSRYRGQPQGDPGGWWDPSHVTVRDGALRLEAYRDPRFDGRWVSGGVANPRALKQTYGKYLVRFRLDGGRGVLGAVLLWPVADVWPPEIDFAENGGTSGARNRMTATLHHGSDDDIIQRSVRGDFTRWHVMGVEWTPGKLVYTLDGKRWATVRSEHVPDQPMELALQTQAGTCGDRFAPCPDASTPRRVDMEVDWVVAYAYRGARSG